MATKSSRMLAIGYRALKSGDVRGAAKMFVMAMGQEDAPITLEQLLPIIPEEKAMEFQKDEESSTVEAPVEEAEEIKEIEPVEKEAEEVESAEDIEEEESFLPEAQMAKIKAVANKIAAAGHRDVAKKIFAAIDRLGK